MSQLPINGQFIKVNDLTMYYEEHGAGEPLVLVHAAFVSSSSWHSVIPIFAKHFKVIVFDSRAHGRTDNPQGKLSYAMMADDTVALIEVLGLQKPSIVGWSDGGQIALEIGIRYPQLANALVVGGAWYKFSESLVATMKFLGFEQMGTVNIEVFERFLAQSGAGTHMAASHHHGEGYLKILAEQLSVPFLTNLNYTKDDFQKIIAPTLILTGDRDPIVPVEQAVEMYRQIPRAELTIYQNTGHEFPTARTESFVSLIMEFLLRHTLKQNQT